jgi:phage-related minor tail protein
VLQDAKNALDGHSGALGLNRQQTIIAQSAVLRFTDAIIAGRNPLTAFALEAHKGVEVLSTDNEGMAGGLAKVAGLINPVTIGIAAITAVIAIGTAAWISYADAMAKLETIAGGAGAVIGVTGQALEQNAEAAASAGVLTVGAARKIETGFVEMGGIGSGVLTGLTKLTADFAASTGQTSEQAEQALGKIFQDPIKGAEELASRYGTLSQAQVEQIRHIEDENGVYAAQAKLLDDLGPAFDGAAKHAEGLKASFDDIKSSISEAWAKLGGFLTGVTDATPAAQRLQQLLSERAKLGDTFAPGLSPNLISRLPMRRRRSRVPRRTPTPSRISMRRTH